MEIHFNATELGCVEENDALICGAANTGSAEPYHYITIQGFADPEDEDGSGIHFEIDDQINGNYNLLASCSVSRSELRVELTRDVDWYPGLERVVVDCSAIPSEQVDEMIAGLQRLFHDRPADLHVARA